MKKIFCIILMGLALPSLAGDSDETLRKNLAQLDKLIKANTINLKELHAKRSAFLKKLAIDKREAAQTKKPDPYAAKLKAEYAKKKAAAAKKPIPKKKPARSTKSGKTASAIHQKAEAARAKFLKRFDQNRDGKVTKAEAKAVLTTEAKARAGGREKKKKK
jgi:hypothetical protein